MDAEFWHERWAENRIGFHKSEANDALIRHIGALGLPPGARIFLPLCGKTLDAGWLMGQGFRVAGAELSEIAIRQMFEEMGVTPEISETGACKLYRAEGIEMFVGDIFDLTPDLLGPVTASYDRAALVALPEKMRGRYAAHLATVTAQAPQLLLTFGYDQAAMDGPPFSVPQDEVRRHYQDAYTMTVLEEAPIPGGLKGVVPADQTVWMLR